MLKSVSGNWKQPVGYNFVKNSTKAEDIVRNVKSIIRLSRNAGYKVVSIVCDQGNNNTRAINMLLEETKRKYIRSGREFKDRIIEIDEDKIIC